jgi:hypothetical protein
MMRSDSPHSHHYRSVTVRIQIESSYRARRCRYVEYECAKICNPE